MGLTTSVEIRLDAESLAAIRELTAAINSMNGNEKTDVNEDDDLDEAEELKPAKGSAAEAWQT